jgi:rsbT co-antagonist protein RsbR
MGDTPNRLISRLLPEEKTLLRRLGTAFASILQGKLVPVPETDRQDELGILATLANRIGHEIVTSRQRDEAMRKDLEDRLTELRQSYAQQEQLLETIRALSSPLLLVHQGVLLLPVIGHMSTERSQSILSTLLDGIVAHRAHVVILDLTSAVSGDETTSAMICRASTAVRLLGAELMLSGVSAEFARIAVSEQFALAATRSYPALRDALTAARKRSSSFGG